jgi:putative hydrolase of the HAD superfamily
MLKFALFDLDNTLYPQNSGLWEEIGRRISVYMTERLGYDPEEVHERRVLYHRTFGTTLNALRHYYGIKADDFLKFVHDIPLENHIQPDPQVDHLLGEIPLRKVIYTNADATHAARVLEHLGIAHHFEKIIDILTLDFVNKPDVESYRRALGLIGADPRECVFIEDSLTNLLPAREMGMVTVFIGPEEDAAGADFRIGHLLELGDCIRRILASR